VLRAHGAVGQDRTRSLKWAEKQENFQPKEMCFFLTSTFIEQNRDLSTRRTTTAWDGFFTVWPDINSYLARLLMYNAKAGESPALQFSH